MPDGPSTTTNSPAATSRSTAESAWTAPSPDPYTRDTPLRLISDPALRQRGRRQGPSPRRGPRWSLSAPARRRPVDHPRVCQTRASHRPSRGWSPVSPRLQSGGWKSIGDGAPAALGLIRTPRRGRADAAAGSNRVPSDPGCPLQGGAALGCACRAPAGSPRRAPAATAARRGGASGSWRPRLTLCRVAPRGPPGGRGRSPA